MKDRPGSGGTRRAEETNRARVMVLIVVAIIAILALLLLIGALVV